MSAVLMCDVDGTLFSVNEVGWRSMTEQWNNDPSTKMMFNNEWNHAAVTRHICPACVAKQSAPTPVIRPAITKADDDA